MACNILLHRKETTPHPNFNSTAILQGNISRLAEHHRNEEARKQLDAARQRLERLQQNNTPSKALQRLDSFIGWCFAACERAEVRQ